MVSFVLAFILISASCCNFNIKAEMTIKKILVKIEFRRRSTEGQLKVTNKQQSSPYKCSDFTLPDIDDVATFNVKFHYEGGYEKIQNI
jgi:hypothetical protein